MSDVKPNLTALQQRNMETHWPGMNITSSQS